MNWVIDAINREIWAALRKLAKPGMRANEYIKLWENSAKIGHPVRVGKLINVERDSRYLDDKPCTLYSFALENRDGTLNPHWLQISVREEEKKPVLAGFSELWLVNSFCDTSNIKASSASRSF